MIKTQKTVAKEVVGNMKDLAAFAEMIKDAIHGQDSALRFEGYKSVDEALDKLASCLRNNATDLQLSVETVEEHTLPSGRKVTL
jgi:hypothetical protein